MSSIPLGGALQHKLVYTLIITGPKGQRLSRTLFAEDDPMVPYEVRTILEWRRVSQLTIRCANGNREDWSYDVIGATG